MKDTDIQALAGNIVHYVLADGQAEHCIEWVTKVLRAEFACEACKAYLECTPRPGSLVALFRKDMVAILTLIRARLIAFRDHGDEIDGDDADRMITLLDAIIKDREP